MKQKLSFLVLTIFFFVNGFSQTVGTQPPNLIQCGNEVFDLTQQTEIILGAQDPQFFTVHYFEDWDNAFNNTNPIAVPNAHVAVSGDAIYARVINLQDNSYAIITFLLLINDWEEVPINEPGVVSTCDNDGDGFAAFDLTSVINQITNGNQDLEVTFHQTPSDAESGSFAIPNPESYTGVTPYVFSVFVRITNINTGCYTTTAFEVDIVECTDNSVSGTLTFDTGNNDCASAATPGAYIRLQLILEDNTHYTYTDANGNYTFTNLPAGDSHLTVAGQGPFTYQTYPTGYTVTSAGELTDYNFCLGEPAPVDDVAVTVIPYQNPRPGFPMTYALLLQNYGTTTLSGNATFQFDNTMMDYTDSVPAMTLSGNVLSIPYTDLAQGDVEYIYVNFIVMTPPTVNQDDIIVVEANITPVAEDINPLNNADEYELLVVNSWDPNDITCREGEFITEEQADDYLHYIIRFQNEGNADAIHIRVEETLDAKLDPATFQPLGASHDYRIEMVNNEVNFIFDDINLPGEDNEPQSHGFITYRIKPRANVQLGDTFEATAAIFFDFNEPVITNTATTTIQNVAGVEEAFANAFVVYPNPASGVVNIHTNDISASAVGITIANVLGKTVMNTTLQMQGHAASLDVSALDGGMYFITLAAEGKSVTKKLVVK